MAEKTVRRTSAEAATALFDDLFSTGPDDDNGLPRDLDAVLIERDLIESNENNPRKYFPEDGPKGLKALGASMREAGQQQNIVVRPHPTKRGKYQLVAGERRWRAAGPKYGDLPVLKAVVRNFSDYEVARIMLDENEVREDVTPIARARGLQRLYDVSPGIHRDGSLDARAKPTWDQVAKSVGLTRVSAARVVALLQLDPDVQDKMERLGLSEKHGRALLQLRDDPRAQRLLLAAIEPDPDDEARELRLSGNGALRQVEAWREQEQREEAAAKKQAEARSSTWTPQGEPHDLDGTNQATTQVPAPASRPLADPLAELQRGTGFDQGSGAASAQTAQTAQMPERIKHPAVDALGAALQSVQQAGESVENAAPDAENTAAIMRQIPRMVALLYELMEKIDDEPDESNAQIERLRALAGAGSAEAV